MAIVRPELGKKEGKLYLSQQGLIQVLTGCDTVLNKGNHTDFLQYLIMVLNTREAGDINVVKE